MTFEKSPAAYVGCQILQVMTNFRFESDTVRRESVALRKIWYFFKEDRIRLVTCEEQIERDIIIGLNSLGCCVTDALQLTDNIDEYEKWNNVDREESAQWRQIIDFFDQLEVLGDYEYPRNSSKKQADEDPEEHLSIFLHNEVLRLEGEDDCHAKRYEEDMAILRDCANDLNSWYEKDAWRNLRGVEYDLNWKLLEKMLREHEIEPTLRGESAARNKFLLGLLNRVIGFGKKSCSRLPLEPDHVHFIVDAVMKKYYHRQDDCVVHIMKCIEHDVDYFLSIDDRLIDSFNKKKNLLVSHPCCKNLRLEIIRPTVLLSRLQ